MLIVLIAIRIALPYVVLHYANKALTEMNGYYGHIRDVDLALWRGAYKIKHVYINKVELKTGKQHAFFKSELVDLSLEWRALFHGSVKGELEFDNSFLYFTREKVEPGQVIKDSSDFRVLLRKLMPIQVNRFEVNNGKVHYLDSSMSPVVDVKMDKMHILASNLKNVYKPDEELPSTIDASADVYKGTLKFRMRLNPLSEKARFYMNSELSNTDLTQLNDFFKAYGHFDVHHGTFGLYTEMATKDGEFEGYVKPLIKDLKVIGPEDKKDSFIQKIWEHIVGAAGVIFRNQPKDQVGTKVKLKGTLSEPKAATWYAVLELLRNAFVEALKPSVEHEINFNQLGKDEGDKKKK